MALKHKNRKGFSIIRWVFLSTTTTVFLLYVDILFRNKRVQPFTDQFKNLIRQHNGRNTEAEKYEETTQEVCSVPLLNLANDKIRYYFNGWRRVVCRGKQLFSFNDSLLRVNRTLLRDTNLSHCVYRNIHWITDYEWIYSKPLIRIKRLEPQIYSEFFRIQCYLKPSNITVSTNKSAKGTYQPPQTNPRKTSNDNNLQSYGETAPFDQFFAQIRPKANVLERISRIEPLVNSTQMDVLMFGLDSMSHMSYQRLLPKTYAYLKDTLKAVILDAYNIVGDATIAAYTPILTGQSLNEVLKSPERDGNADFIPMIWKEFSTSGYVTLFAEDMPCWGIFQKRFTSFREIPVDHYMRHFWLAAENSTTFRSFCLGPRPYYEYIPEYLKDFFRKYPKTPKFAVASFSQMSHDSNDPIQAIDLYLRNFLEDLRISGYLDNTLLIMMADHGQRIGKVRYTTQGSLEERLPMMSLTFPEAFRKQYPHLMKNLINNKKRLSTPFDLHETLQSILNTYNAEKTVKYTDRGISLLNVIPINRTCQSAGIELHWCTCKKYEILNSTDKNIKQAAIYIVLHINHMVQIADKKCAKLTLKKILEGKKVYFDELVLKGTKISRTENGTSDQLHYQLIIETSPSNAVYEATVQKVVANNSLSISGDISRINRYDKQSNCIVRTYPRLRGFCFCKKTIGNGKH